jgi:CubicO group peptidase (beta-lactamase class C family)
MTLQEKIGALCRRAMEERTFPGCVVGYIRAGETVVLPFGRLEYEANSPAVTAQTVYDVASITKSIPTACVILRLVEDGRLGLHDDVSAILPELRCGRDHKVTVWNLLTYTAVFALPDGLSGVAKQTPDRVLEAIMAAPLATPPGEQYQYANAPAVLLGLVAERLLKKPLDVIAQMMFFDGLRMTKTTFYPAFPMHQVAPTEHDWRGKVHGDPHDEGAWAMRQQGLVAGNAALFSTAGDLLKFAQMLLNEGEFEGRRYFKPETVKQMHTNQIPELGESTGLGWELN